MSKKNKMSTWTSLKNIFKYLTTKEKVTEEDEYFDYKQNRYITKEEITRKNEITRIICLFVVINLIILPFAFELYSYIFQFVIFGVGTILFCIEILIKGSGIK